MFKRSTTICLVLIGLCQTMATAQEASFADDEPTTPFQIPWLDTRIDVDGVLDEPVWERAWNMTLDYEVQPGENTPAPVRTEVFVMHDESRLYVGFRAYDPDPSADTRATSRTRWVRSPATAATTATSARLTRSRVLPTSRRAATSSSYRPSPRREPIFVRIFRTGPLSAAIRRSRSV